MFARPYRAMAPEILPEEIPAGRYITLRVDDSNGSIRKSRDPQRDIEKAITAIRKLKIRGYAPKEIGKMQYIAAIREPEKDDETLMAEMNEKIGRLQLSIAIRVGTLTVGGPITEPFHPDIVQIMKIFPDFRTLHITDQLIILEEYKLNQAKPIP